MRRLLCPSPFVAVLALGTLGGCAGQDRQEITGRGPAPGQAGGGRHHPVRPPGRPGDRRRGPDRPGTSTRSPGRKGSPPASTRCPSTPVTGGRAPATPRRTRPTPGRGLARSESRPSTTKTRRSSRRSPGADPTSSISTSVVVRTARQRSADPFTTHGRLACDAHSRRRRVHADRAAGRHRHHRHPHRPAPARRAEGPRGRRPHAVPRTTSSRSAWPCTTTTTPTATLPPGVGDYGCCWGTWAMAILPYIEQDNMWRLYVNFDGNDITGIRYGQGTNPRQRHQQAAEDLRPAPATRTPALSTA